ncbi:MAG TPA: signal peptidase II [Chloroflexi bacterium]|nr:signal peptidase II [Chloroflexota bacterium]
MLKTLKAYGFLFLIGGGVLLADQTAKAWIEAHIPFARQTTPFAALPWLHITNWHNSGMAFGLGQAWGPVLLALGVVYALGVLLAFPAIARSGWWLRWGMAIQWGGALGNLLDRLRHGYVTDFIAVGRFPVFNLADAAISLSVAFLLLGELFADDEPAPETPPHAPDAETSPAPEETPHA